MRRSSTVLVCLISGCVFMVACSKESSLISNGTGGSVATGGDMASGGGSGIAGNGAGGDSRSMGGMNSGRGGMMMGAGGKVGSAGGSAGGAGGSVSSAGGTVICGVVQCPIDNCTYGIVPSTSPCGCPSCAPAPDAGTAKDTSAGITCGGDGGFGLAAVARQCTQNSDCTIHIAPTCCGADEALGIAKAEADAYSGCFVLPPGACSGLGCSKNSGYMTDTGKTTPWLGTATQPIDLVSVTCIGHLCTTDVASPPDAGPDATTLGDIFSATCGQVTTQAACDSRSDCHSVFADPGTCDCAVSGCCEHFNRCADGGHANCSGPVACTVSQPYCESPYVLSYANNCYEGCVLQTECSGADAAVTTPTCPQTPPTNTLSCGSASMTCFYDNCPSTGRTQARCAGGTWTVQTAACSTVNCISRTCPSGQICLVTEGGAVGVQCVDNACGQGPVTAECGTGIGGCVVNATLTGGVTITCNTCPQGGCP
jgi:hypothetical protein